MLTIMKKKKINLDTLKVKSFVTNETKFSTNTIKGGAVLMTDPEVGHCIDPFTAECGTLYGQEHCTGG